MTVLEKIRNGIGNNRYIKKKVDGFGGCEAI